MNRLPRPGVLAALALLGDMPKAELVPTPVPDHLLTVHDVERIFAAAEKRACRAAKWRKEGR